MKKLFFIAIFIILLPSLCGATDWFVDSSNDGGTEDGTAWATAWGKLSDVVWGASGVTAGDTLYISGGSSGKTYTSRLTIGASGTNDTTGLISIKPGSEHPTLSSGHTGTVTITVTSGCTSGNISDPCSGIYVGTTRSYWTIDGGASRKIRVTGCTDSGITIIGTGYHQTVKRIEVDTNSSASHASYGEPAYTSGLYSSLSYASSSNYPQLTIDNVTFHDNAKYQVAFWTGDGTHTAAFDRCILKNSTIYNPRGEDVVNAGAGYGSTINNNTIYGPWGITRYTDHPDGVVVQTSYAKVFNNRIYDLQVGTNTTVGYTGTLTSLSGANLVDTAANFFNVAAAWEGRVIRFTSGALNGNSYTVSTYVDTNTLTLSTNIQTAGAQVGDAYQMYGTMGAYIYPNQLLASTSNVWIFNNLIYNTSATAYDSSYPQCITPSLQMSSTGCDYCMILNNTCINMPGSGLQLTWSDTETLTNSVVANNLMQNIGFSGSASATGLFLLKGPSFTTGSWGDGKDLTIDYNIGTAGVGGNTQSCWAVNEAGSCYGKMYSWGDWNALCTAPCNDNGSTSAPTLDSNYAPTRADTVARDKGVSLSSYCSTVPELCYDINNVARPQGAAWDIGAYEYYGTAVRKLNNVTGVRVTLH